MSRNRGEANIGCVARNRPGERASVIHQMRFARQQKGCFLPSLVAFSIRSGRPRRTRGRSGRRRASCSRSGPRRVPNFQPHRGVQAGAVGPKHGGAGHVPVQFVGQEQSEERGVAEFVRACGDQAFGQGFCDAGELQDATLPITRQGLFPEEMESFRRYS
jgi:hypothetical protein